MSDAYLWLIVLLGIINLQQSHAQLLTGEINLNNNNLIKDFLNNFPEATVKQNEGNEQNILNNVTIEYLFPVNGMLLTPLPDISSQLVTDQITIAGKSFIGGTMEITVRSNRTTASFGNRVDNSSGTIISGRISNIGDSTNSHDRLALEAMLLLIEVSPELNRFTLDDIILQFVAGDTDQLPYNITQSDRAMGDRIKNWLSNKLPVVVDKYQENIDQLTNAGALILNDSVL